MLDKYYRFTMADTLQLSITHFILILNINQIIKVHCNDNPATISVVTDSEFKVQDHINILDPPNVLSNGELITVEYKCSDDRIVGLEITTFIEKYKNKKIFQKAWKCSSSNNESKLRRVKLKLKDKHAYRPDIFNKHFELASRTKLQAWVLDPVWWTSAKRNHNGYSRSKIKVSYDATILPPYSRPQKKIPGCLPWSWQVLLDLSTKYIATCKKEQEIVDAIVFPMALNGLPYGVIRTFTRFADEGLEHKRQAAITIPSYTVSMWLYVLEYCKHTWTGLCSFMMHVTWDGKYLSPVIFMNKEGKLHIQVLLNDGQTNAALTTFAVPKHSWFRLVLTLYSQMWTLTLNYGEHLNETITTSYRIPGTVHLDDTKGLFSFGGFETTPGFKGYIGQTTIYRNKAVYHDAIPFPSPYHQMFELGLSKREERCRGFIEWTDRRVKAFNVLREIRKNRDTCQNYFSKFVRKPIPTSVKDQCLQHEGFRPSHYRYTNKLIRRSVINNISFNKNNASKILYQRAVDFVEQGFGNIKKTVRILKQAACYGNHDAMYLLAVILNNGITVKADEIQAQAYLMMASLEKHRLSSMSLAHKHNYGLDGVPFDKDQAYMYYKYVADTTRTDKEIHKETDVFTESIRLTDEAQLREQTDEDGDIFHWLQHQAQKGVFSAQQHMGRALYWGSNGLRRNMQAAIDYFRMGAETQDPQAMYDYGIVVLKGQGTKKNVTEGLSHIKRSAEKKNPAAMNALGWYALNFENNIIQAKEYFEQAYRYGNADAAYNLGWMHQMGKYPDKPMNVDLALTYYNFAAVRHQIDACVQVAHINSKGTNILPRNNAMAVEWARFIAEKNPALGFVLRKAVKFYRDTNIPAALVFYIMTADAGIEVGSFNTAWLCEDNKDGVVTSIGKECQWRNYNLTIQRELQFVDPYSLIKMGDYHYYGCEGHQDIQKAASLYAQAAIKNDPHAIFNLGFMLEDGADIMESNVWNILKIPKDIQKNNYTLLKELYKRCKDSPRTEAYIPCSIALYRVQGLEIWSFYEKPLKVIGFIVVAIVTSISIYSIVAHMSNARFVQQQTI